MDTSLLSVRHAAIDFADDIGGFRAVDRLTISNRKGSTLPLVCETSSANTVKAHELLRI